MLRAHVMIMSVSLTKKRSMKVELKRKKSQKTRNRAVMKDPPSSTLKYFFLISST